jgi:hypothetical protein
VNSKSERQSVRSPAEADHGAYADIAEQKYGDPKGRTYAQLAAEGQFNAAIKVKTDAAREIADRLECKAAQPLGDESAGMSVT